MKKEIREFSTREIEVIYPKSKNPDSYIGIYDIGNKTVCDNIISLIDHLWENKKDYENHNEVNFETQNILPNTARQDRALFIETFEFNEDVGEFGKWLQTSLELYIEKYAIDHSLTSNTNKFHQVEPYQNGYSIIHYEAAGGESANRHLTWLMYLNDIEHGGETEFPMHGLRVKPKAGRLIIWPAAYTHPHRGNPPYQRKSYITGWFYAV